MMLVLPRSLQSELPVSRAWIQPRQRLPIIGLFSLATIVSFYLGTQLAMRLGVGTLMTGGIVQLNSLGGLLVGSLIGLAQWAALRPVRLPKVWLGVTAIGWAIAASLPSSLNAILSGGSDWLTAINYFHPLTFLTLSLGQWWVLRQRTKVGWQWFLLPIAQILLVLVIIAIVLITMFAGFVLSLAYSSQPSFWLLISGLHGFGTSMYSLMILAHSTLPVLALCFLSKSVAHLGLQRSW